MKKAERIKKSRTLESESPFSNLQDLVGIYLYAEVHHHYLLPLPASSLNLVRSNLWNLNSAQYLSVEWGGQSLQRNRGVSIGEWEINIS
jgi:hypothetical protein